MVARPLLTVAVVLALLAGAGWLLRAPPAAGDAGDYPITVRAPDGSTFWSGTAHVSASEATPLGTLRAASTAGNFTLGVEATAIGAYVKAIGPYAETSSAGWCYFVDSGTGFAWRAEAADALGLHAGETILWSWNAAASGAC